MDADDKVTWPPRHHGVVHLDVRLEQLLALDPALGHDCRELRGAVERKARVVELDPPAAELVQVPDLLPVCLDEISEVLRWILRFSFFSFLFTCQKIHKV